MQKQFNLTHSCVTEGDECLACLLTDWTIDILCWFNKRPDEFSSSHAQKVLSKALLIKLAIESNKGVMRVKT